MDKIVELVTAWADFTAKHPNARLEDFCRYYLIKEREGMSKGQLLGGMTPNNNSKITLNKLILFIARLHTIYANIAMEGIKLKHFEEFLFLNSIHIIGNPKKTEVIYYMMNELSTGLNILASLKDQGYIVEEEDPNDKRSKRVHITPEGLEILLFCRQRLGKMSALLLSEMDEEDTLLCIQLLKNTEIKFSALWQQHKGQKFDDIYKEVMAEKDNTK